MFANTFQSGLLSIFYSVGSNPLQLWDKQVKNGHIRRIVDDEVRSLVLEISGTNVATTYITCPIKPRLSLGIKLPFLVMIIKNMKKYFTFEIQILDDKDMHRRFRVSNFQSTTKVRPFCTTMPIGLSSGWNQVQFNLADFTKRAYGSTYLETTRVQIHANVRIRRIYFSDVLYADDELPNEYKLFLPTAGGPPRPSKSEKKESISKDKKEEKKTSVAAGLPEAEPPSGALPSPESPNVEDMPPTTPEEPPSEPLTVITETVEPQSESPTVGPTSEEITTEPETEVFVDAVAEGEMFEGAPTEAPQGEVPPAESEQAPAETEQVVDASEAPTEAPAAEASAEEKPVEEAAPAVAPTEEAPLQETLAAQEEAPLPEAPAEEAPSAEAPPEAEAEPAAEAN